MPRDILSEKRLIANSTEFAMKSVKGTALVQKSLVGASYPYRPEVPGVWVQGPDQAGHYTVSVNISVAGMSIPDAVNKLRLAIQSELRIKDLVNLVKAIDINVEDWTKVA